MNEYVRKVLERKAWAVGAAAALLSLLQGCVTESKYNALEARYQQLQASLTSDQAEITLLEGKLKVTMVNEVLFPEGGFRLTPKSKSVLSKLVPTLSDLKETKVVVDGYTDTVPIGPGLKREGIDTNLELSSRRADAVAEYLVGQGVSQDLVSAQGFGEADPVASNDTAEGRAKNRRIEVTLVGPGT